MMEIVINGIRTTVSSPVLGDLYPLVDDTYWLGSSSIGWKGVYMVDALITDESGYVDLRTTANDAYVGLKAADILSYGVNGLDVNPGSDVDADLITVGVTGAPKIFWDESADEFASNKGFILGHDKWLGGYKSNGTISHIIEVNTNNETHIESQAGIMRLMWGCSYNIQAWGHGTPTDIRELILRAGDATAILTVVPSPKIVMRGYYWSGGVNTDNNFTLWHEVDTVAPTSHIEFIFGASTMMELSSAGVLSVVGGIITSDAVDIEIGAAGAIKSGATDGDTALFKANDTTFITLTTGATDVCTMAGITMSGTWLATGTVIFPAITLGGTISGGSQSLSSLGRLGVGTAVNTRFTIYAVETFTITDDISKAGIAAEVYGAKTSAVFTSSLRGLNGGVVLAAANTQNWTATVGLRGVNGAVESQASSAGIVTGAVCFYAEATFSGTGATITNWHGLYVSNPSAPSSKITNAYGVYIAAITGGATLNYAIYAAGGLNYLAGATTFGNIATWGTSVDSAAVADQASIGCYEISAGHRALALSSEEVVVAAVGVASTEKYPVRINGATKNIMLCA